MCWFYARWCHSVTLNLICLPTANAWQYEYEYAVGLTSIAIKYVEVECMFVSNRHCRWMMAQRYISPFAWIRNFSIVFFGLFAKDDLVLNVGNPIFWQLRKCATCLIVNNCAPQNKLFYVFLFHFRSHKCFFFGFDFFPTMAASHFIRQTHNL